MPKREFSQHLLESHLPPDTFVVGVPVEDCSNCAQGLCSKHKYHRVRLDRIENIPGSVWHFIRRLPSDATERQARQALVNVLLRRSRVQPRTTFERLVEEDDD
jgi:hypothetical protein